ncbi:hypothetical protein CIK75_00540 [Glutamicibacter sp. BW78]|nr:hypothetical protein CIK75_00540 [Glutamicibacter sp. BW78]
MGSCGTDIALSAMKQLQPVAVESPLPETNSLCAVFQVQPTRFWLCCPTRKVRRQLGVKGVSNSDLHMGQIAEDC